MFFTWPLFSESKIHFNEHLHLALLRTPKVLVAPLFALLAICYFVYELPKYLDDHSP